MGAAPVLKLSVDEYLELDEREEIKSEYHDGEVFPVECSTLAHARIGANLARRLGERLDGKPCMALNPLRIRISKTQYVYPDLAVICGKPETTDGRFQNPTNPKLILEVLSPATAGYNYGRKFSLYAEIPTLEEYVLIAQDELRVDVFRKSGAQWILARYSGRDSVAKLDSLGIELPLAEVYAGLDDSYFVEPAP